MAGNNLERRLFLKYCAATAVGSSLIYNPMALLADESDKRKKEKFKLSIPRWIIYDNGSYDLISKEIILRNCRPAINGQGVMPKNVFLGDSPKGKRIVYELPGGFLMLDLKTNKNSVSIGAEFSGFSQTPRWFYPISQAQVFGVNHFFKQGYGTDGPCGIYSLPGIETDDSKIECYDSFMSFGFLGKEETIAIGNIDHSDFHQRFSIYNRRHSKENYNLNDENQVFFESGILLDETRIDNEYIKLPELHFFTGNRPLETFNQLAWETSEKINSRKNTPSSYHWILSPKKDEECKDILKKQLEYVKANNVKLHTMCVKGYCIEGDWLEPEKDWTGGLDNAARMIYKEGFRAGISLAPFRISNKSKIFKNHQDWIIKDNYNNNVPEEIHEDECFYALDLTNQGVQKYISRVFKSLRKMGFIFYELTHLHYGIKDSNLVNRKIHGNSNIQIFRDTCQLIRDEIGAGSLWMANQTPYAPVIGFADIVKTSSGDSLENNTITFSNIIQESWYSYYFNNIYWQNSPGEITFNDNNFFNEDERLSLMRWAAILGGAVGTSDDMTTWDEDQLEQFRFLEPDQRPQNAYLPFWPDKAKMKVAVREYKNKKSWGVLIVNDTDKQQDESYSLEDIIERESAYVFAWDKTKLNFGEQNHLSITLSPGESNLFYLSEINEAPHPLLTISGELQKNSSQSNS